jgi:hypothetical protein
MTIKDNKEDLRRGCHFHKLARDKSALTLMCGRDEEPQPSINGGLLQLLYHGSLTMGSIGSRLSLDLLCFGEYDTS